ncbi:MAG: DMT family transporter [Ferrimonas sp.]
MRNNEATTRRIGVLFALLATLLWALNFVIARGVTELIPPAALAWWRWLIATVVLLPFALRACWCQRQLLWRHKGYLLLCSLLVVSLYNLLMYKAAHSTSALNLTLIAITAPVIMLILAAICYQEPLSKRQLIGTLLSLCGVLLLITQGDLHQIVALNFGQGDLLALISAVMFAIYSLLLRRKPSQMAPVAFLFAIFACGTLCLLPFYLWESQHTPSIHWQPSLIGAVLYLGIGASLLAYYLWNKAIMSAGIARASSVYYAMPLFSGLSAAWFLHEPLLWLHGLSGILIILGVVLANQNTHKQSKP